MDAIIPLRGAEPVLGTVSDHTRLLGPANVAMLTGMSYEKALALLKVHGVKLGKRYYITVARLAEALEGRRGQ